MSEAKGYAGN
jgi:hypothetical protein